VTRGRAGGNRDAGRADVPVRHVRGVAQGRGLDDDVDGRATIGDASERVNSRRERSARRERGREGRSAEAPVRRERGGRGEGEPPREQVPRPGPAQAGRPAP